MPVAGLDDLLETQRTELARRHLDGTESWLRRYMHQVLGQEFGPLYITASPLLKESLKGQVRSKKEQLPSAREVDLTTFGQLVTIATNSEIFSHWLGDGLRRAYPQGLPEAQRFLGILVDIRNHIAHGHSCNLRQLERAICYGNDLIDALREHLAELGMTKDFDVPMIIRYVDNQGNDTKLEGVSTDVSARIVDFRKAGHGDLHVGDQFVAEVEVDPSFTSAAYEVTWTMGNSSGNDQNAKVIITPAHVGEQLELRFTVTTGRDWHRYYGMDDSLCLIFRVLPPIA